MVTLRNVFLEDKRKRNINNVLKNANTVKKKYVTKSALSQSNMLRRRQDKREGREKDPKLLQTSQVKIICIGLSRLTADSILSSKK